MKKSIPWIFLALVLAPGLCRAEVSQSPKVEHDEFPEVIESLEVLDSPEVTVPVEVIESTTDIDSSEIVGTPQSGETIQSRRVHDTLAYASTNGEDDGQDSGDSSSGCAMSARTPPGTTGWITVFLLSAWCLQRRRHHHASL